MEPIHVGRELEYAALTVEGQLLKIRFLTAPMGSEKSLLRPISRFG